MSVTAAIETENLGKKYGNRAALRGIDLTAPAGTVLGVLGRNGAGKTTTVRILSTLIEPDSGSARVAGLDVTRRQAAVRARIGLAGQYAAVDENLTGRENLVLLGTLLHIGRRAAKARARELLDEFGLTEAGDRRVGTYSGGMRRRLDLASCLISRPPVLFLDEPTTGLDPASRATLWSAIREQAAGGTTVLLTTQYLEEADRLADQIAVIEAGKVIAAGSPDRLKRDVGGEWLEVAVADPALTMRAREALAAVLGDVVSVEAASGKLRAPLTGGTAGVAAAAGQLAAAGVEVADFALHRPSLDDVFFALTEGAARKEFAG